MERRNCKRKKRRRERQSIIVSGAVLFDEYLFDIEKVPGKIFEVELPGTNGTTARVKRIKLWPLIDTFAELSAIKVRAKKVHESCLKRNSN